MKSRVDRSTVDLSAYPDLVVIYLGMRVNAFRGFGTMLRFIFRVGKALREEPVGLLANSFWFYSPRHLGVRQYWQDFESLERWARSLPHKQWWQTFLRDSGGTGFYHEAYFMRGGMEAIYDDTKLPPLGFQTFAPGIAAHGPMFSARTRLRLTAETPIQPECTTESELLK